MGKSRSGRGHHHFSFSPYSAATLARGGNMLFGKPLLLRKSNERPSRLTHSSGIYWAKTPRQRLSQLLSLSFNVLENPRSLARKDESTSVQKKQLLTFTVQAAAVMVLA